MYVRAKLDIAFEVYAFFAPHRLPSLFNGGYISPFAQTLDVGGLLRCSNRGSDGNTIALHTTT